VQNNGLKWFNPNGAQEEFINAVGQGDVFIGIFSAANGVGKTALLANLLGACVFDTDNPWFDKPFFKDFPYVHRGRIASSSKNIEEIGAIQTEIKRWFPKGKYSARRKGKQFDSEYMIDDWVIDIMSFEQDASQFESATLGIMIFDEPPPMKILFASLARMRKGGIILIFMTPLDTGGEIIEDLTSKEDIEYEGETIGKVVIKYAGIEENCKQHGVRGQLEHKDIEKMLNFYDADERDARAKGKPVHLIGRIYPDFEDKDPYVVDDFIIPEEWARVCILDPHNAIPYAFSWAAIDPTGQVWIYDEFPGEDLEKMHVSNLTIPDYARLIGEKEGRDKIKLRLADPYFANVRYANTGKTVKEEFADLGLDFENGDTSGLDVGHKKVREYMKYQKAFPVSPSNHPKLHVFKSCRNHWRSLMRYKRKISKTGEVKDKIVIDETYKHFCDNIRHLLMRADLYDLQKASRDEPPSYRVTGDMKDIRFEDDEEDTNYGAYRQAQGGVR
jgi:phage terminase large subunit-like protein